MRAVNFIVGIACLAGASAPCWAAFPRYRIVETATAVNGSWVGFAGVGLDRGGSYAIGYSGSNGQGQAADVYRRNSDGAITNLGRPPNWGPFDGWSRFGGAEADGSFVQSADYQYLSHVVRYVPGTGFQVYPRYRPDLYDYNWQNSPYGTSPSGLAVGVFHADFQGFTAMAWHPDGTSELLQPGDWFSAAFGISDSGLIAGVRRLTNGTEHNRAGYWDAARVWHPLSQGGTEDRGWWNLTISPDGSTISGWDFVQREMVLWSIDGTILHRYRPPSGPLNYSLYSADNQMMLLAPQLANPTDAILWSPTEGAVSLTSLLLPEHQGYSRLYFDDISRDGKFVGEGVRNGVQYSLLFEPVPEPASFLALSLGLAAVATRRRRKH